MYRLTIKDILEATGGVLLCGDENTEIKDVCINSKEIKPGDLFVPIIGERVDAHRFIESALHTGAATLTSQHTDIVVSEKPFVYVSDTEKALQDIGAYRCDRKCWKDDNETDDCNRTFGMLKCLSDRGQSEFPDRCAADPSTD